MAADILEFITEGLTNQFVICNRTHELILLIIWSWSLFQFTLGLTATKKKTKKRPRWFRSCLFFETEMWSIFATTIMQDGPYLATRLYFMVETGSINQASIFFTCKNALLVLIQTYRIVIIFSKHCNEKRQSNEHDAELAEYEITGEDNANSDNNPYSKSFWPELSKAIRLRRFVQKTNVNMRFRGRPLRQGLTGSTGSARDAHNQNQTEMLSVISDGTSHSALHKAPSQTPLCAQPGGELRIECTVSSEETRDTHDHGGYHSWMQVTARAVLATKKLFGLHNPCEPEDEGENRTDTNDRAVNEISAKNDAQNI